MLKWLIGPLPEWAQSKNPLLRYELQRYRAQDGRNGRVFRIASSVLILSLLVILGYMIATEGFVQPQAGINLADAIFRIAYYPLFIVQIILWIVAFSFGIGVIDNERRRQTWDSLRATEHGAEMAIRTRWVAIFYRVRNLIFVIIVGRIVLTIGILYQITSHRGTYLDLLTANTTPEVPLILGMILLAALITSVFLLPLVSTGVAIALGLWISSTARHRAFAGIFQVIAIMTRLILMGGLFYFVDRILNDGLKLSDSIAFAVMTGFSAFSDWGLTLMSLSRSGEIWATIPYSIFMGAVLLGMVFVLAMLIDLVLNFAIRSAQVVE